MKKAGFTRQERSFIALMRIWAIAFLAAGILFIIAPDYALNYITRVGDGLLGWHSPPMQLGADRFWLVLAVALLFVLSYLCTIIQRNILRNIGYTRPVILAKIVSSIGFAVCFFLYGRHFVYLVAAAVDGGICLITWRFYTNALKSRA